MAVARAQTQGVGWYEDVLAGESNRTPNVHKMTTAECPTTLVKT